MSAMNKFAQLRAEVQMAWMARTEQERRVLTVGGAVLLLALVYTLLIAPAVTGRAAALRALPELRAQAAQMQALAADMGTLAQNSAPQGTPMTRESLAAGMTANSLTATSVSLTGEFAKLEMKAVPFANLVGWLDTLRREQRVAVQEASISAQTPAGMVDASLTLRQGSGAQ